MFWKVFLHGVSIFTENTLLSETSEVLPIGHGLFHRNAFTNEIRLEIAKYYVERRNNDRVLLLTEKYNMSLQSQGFFDISAIMTHIVAKNITFIKNLAGNVFEYLFLQATIQCQYPILMLINEAFREDLQKLLEISEVNHIDSILDLEYRALLDFNTKDLIKEDVKYEILLDESLNSLDTIITIFHSELSIYSGILVDIIQTGKISTHQLAFRIASNHHLMINLLEVLQLLMKISNQSKPETKEYQERAASLKYKLAETSERLLYYLMDHDSWFCQDFNDHFSNNIIESLTSKFDRFRSLDGYFDLVRRLKLSNKSNIVLETSDLIFVERTLDEHVSSTEVMNREVPVEIPQSSYIKKNSGIKSYSSTLEHTLNSIPTFNPRPVDQRSAMYYGEPCQIQGSNLDAPEIDSASYPGNFYNGGNVRYQINASEISHVQDSANSSDNINTVDRIGYNGPTGQYEFSRALGSGYWIIPSLQNE